MKSDEIWWNLMKSDENLGFHQISSGFIRFHQILIFWKFLIIFKINNIYSKLFVSAAFVKLKSK